MLIPIERIEKKIYVIRGKKVMLDADLAEFYEIEIKNLNKAVKHNLLRFPSDFAFQLMIDETECLKFQMGTSKIGRCGKDLPYAFTEQGVAMLSSVLRSKRAIQVNIQIMRAFTKIREMSTSREDLKRKIKEIFEPKKRIGFKESEAPFFTTHTASPRKGVVIVKSYE
jgi:hypothetical protein